MHLSNAGEGQTVAEQCWLEAKLCWVVVVPGAPGATLAKARRLLGGVRRESTPEDRGRTRSATNVNW